MATSLTEDAAARKAARKARKAGRDGIDKAERKAARKAAKAALKVDGKDEKRAVKQKVQSSSDAKVSDLGHFLSFAQAPWNEKVQNALTEAGYSTPTPIQAQSWPVGLIATQDLISVAKTGSGENHARTPLPPPTPHLPLPTTTTTAAAVAAVAAATPHPKMSQSLERTGEYLYCYRQDARLRATTPPSDMDHLRKDCSGFSPGSCAVANTRTCLADLCCLRKVRVSNGP